MRCLPRQSLPLALTAALSATWGPAQAVLLADTNPTPVVHEHSNPREFVRAGSNVFFIAESISSGRELYAMPLATGVTRLLDIRPGATGSRPALLTAVGNRLFFAVGGHELWRSDGTAAGTVRVTTRIHAISAIAAAGNRALVEAFGNQLYGSDGTAAGTSRLGPLNARFRLHGHRRVGPVTYFADFSHREVWATDGTVRGTRRVLAGGVILCGVVGNRLLVRKPGVSGGASSLWSTDGTVAGTTQLGPYHASGPGVSWRGRHYFISHKPGSVPPSLLMTDGRTLTHLKNLPKSALVQLQPSGNRLFVACLTPLLNGASLWVSDGTSAETAAFFTSRTRVTIHAPNLATLGDGRVLFYHETATAGRELWVSDGTPSGTRITRDIRPGAAGSEPRWPSFAGVATGAALFAADDGRLGSEVWVTTGRPNGTRLLADLQPRTTTTGDSDPLLYPDGIGGAAISGHGKAGGSIWLTDGTAAGTRRLGAARFRMPAPQAVGGSIHFAGADAKGAARLMQFDGRRIHPTPTPVAFPQSGDLATLRGRLYFSGAPTGGRGPALMQSDGTALGTFVLKRLTKSWSPVMPHRMTRWRSLLFFLGPLSTHRTALYRSDGTANGTFPVLDPNTSPFSNWQFADLAQSDSRLIVTLYSGASHRLYATDGTVKGTALIHSYRRTSRSLFVDRTIVAGGLIYFSAADATNGEELWVTDGTATGTRLVRDVHPGSVGSEPALLAALDKLVLFIADDGTNGRELWRTDGTAAGTVLVRDIRRGREGQLRRTEPRCAVAGKWLYFAADDGVSGREVWRTDGTAAGTTMIADVSRGPSSSNPTQLLVAGGKLLFAASTLATGNEPWGLDIAAHANPIGHGCAAGAAPTLRASPPKLGFAVRLDVANAGANRRGCLWFGLRAVWPNHLGGGCSLYIDGAKPTVPVAFTTSASGRFSLSTLVPNAPALHGLDLIAQVGVGPGRGTPLGLDLSKGLWIALRR